MTQRFATLRGKAYYVAGIVVIAVLLWVALRPQTISVETVIIDRGTVQSTLVDEGRTRMREIYIVSAPVAGRLLRVEVEPADQVHQGETLARMTRGVSGFIDSRSEAEAHAAVSAAEARERAAIAEREWAVLEDERLEQLAASHLIADADRDAARTRLRAARAAEAAASAEVRRARSALLSVDRDGKSEYISLKAPVAGMVLSVPQESESIIAAGTPVVVLGDPSRVDVVADFLSQDAVQIKPGDRALIENWGGAPVPAIVERIEPVARTKVSALGIEEQRTRVVLDFVGAVPKPLQSHEYRVDVRVVLEEVRDAVRVPLGALFRRGNRWSVYVVEAGRAEERTVELGTQDEQFRVVISGLERDTAVILFPSAEISTGRGIRFRPAESLRRYNKAP